MRRVLLVVACALTGAIFPSFAQAATVKDVAKALNKSPVYVAPDAEGTASNTAGKLKDQLKDGDNIVIVMLPTVDGNPASLARAIDKATGQKQIVGLSTGDSVAAASTIMPMDVATDLMDRAESVSSSTTETLGTFVRNVHNWQAQHKREPAAKPAKKKDNGGGPWFVIIFFLVAIAAAAIVFYRFIQNDRDQDGVKFRSSPDEVRDLLRAVMETRSDVRDNQLRSIIETACADTEQYFRRSSGTGKRGEDNRVFVNHLKSVRSVLKQYIDIQDNQRYYDNPSELMQQGLDAVHGFAVFVEESIRAGRRSDLTNFKVDTEILSAQRFR